MMEDTSAGKQGLTSRIEDSKNAIIEMLDVAAKQVEEGKVVPHSEVRIEIDRWKKS